MKSYIEKIKNIIKKHQVKYKGILILISLLLLYSVFMDPSERNTLFFVFHYTFLVILINAYHCYQINGKMLFYKISLGTSRKATAKQIVLMSLKNIFLILGGLFIYNIFVLLYVKKCIFELISFHMLLEFILIYIFLSVLSLIMGRLMIRFNYYLFVIISFLISFLVLFFFASLQVWIINIILLVINVLLIVYYKKITNKDLPLY